MDEAQDTPYGYCHCGCGEKAPLWKENRPERGMIKGRPQRFIHGHSRRAPDVQWTVDAETGCWNWNGALSRGYGRRYYKGRLIGAHQYAYQRFKGPIPIGREIDHLCRNRACVNPEHLEAVTPAVNTQRGLKAKITAASAMQIRLMRLTTTLSYPQIAEIVGISHPQAWQIANNNCWRMPEMEDSCS